MIIREATDKDLESIINVLRASLGETSSKKTMDVWQYKHVDNPFGKSLVLVAEENGEIIGVRAFMRWKWQYGSNSYDAFRAVDTATHPKHQGKGIFKKLTYKALEEGKANGDHFVFNTPNDQSKPGYLKMGWKEVGKVRINIVPQSPFRLLRKIAQKPDYELSEFDANLEPLLENYNNRLISSNKLFTPKSLGYLQWRYLKNKIQPYLVYHDKDIFVASYLKDRRRFLELRVSECIYSSTIGKKRAKKVIGEWSTLYKPNFISYSFDGRLFNLELNGKFGPVLTFKNINCSEEKHIRFLNEEEWKYTIGDLELF
ncbi:GNAT family N-acetyltransferase [Gramella sp. GC03-9]|uniref:GNAT family N-acetyltransferase n=1 Tax=Christiangramia oceanisediminis TaxID=2920386 RepID=A0A9X2I4V3_9FLAO|nr:GNAT family N-acetyltransferase [Gramella oceanisediminis]MCP9199900.1 GNAT family N-acetyltransferase [Gramella oceanisediminis]